MLLYQRVLDGRDFDVCHVTSESELLDTTRLHGSQRWEVVMSIGMKNRDL
jgi:hypothetical protein